MPGVDFYSVPRFSPDGTNLAWIELTHPDMPWEGPGSMLQISPSKVARIPLLVPSCCQKAGCGQCRAAVVDSDGTRTICQKYGISEFNSECKLRGISKKYLEMALECFDDNTRAR